MNVKEDRLRAVEGIDPAEASEEYGTRIIGKILERIEILLNKVSKYMKIKSFFFGLTVGLTLMIFLPYLIVLLNIKVGFPVIDSLFLKILGMTLVGLGIFIFLFNSLAFWRYGKGTPVPIEPPKELVAVGLYRYVRNSMYLGYFEIVFGEFLIFGYLFLLVYAIIFVMLTHLYVVFVEEPGLKKRFGGNYDRYCKSVPRWIPKFN